MTNVRNRRDSKWRLRYELVTAQALLWAAGAGRTGAIRPDAHIYLAQRYERLASCYEAEGRAAKAARLREKAERHYRDAGPDGSPSSAAMAMPLPRRPVFTDARGMDDEDPGAAA